MDKIREAIVSNDINKIKYAIDEYKIANNSPDSDFNYLLTTYVHMENLSIFDILIKFIDIHVLKKDGKTVLSNIISNSSLLCDNDSFDGMSRTCMFLLDRMNNISTKDEDGYSALILYLDGISTNNLYINEIKLNVIKKMLEMDPSVFEHDPNVFKRENPIQTMLHLALDRSSYDLLHLALKNIKNRLNIYYLFYALDLGTDEYDIIELLLSYIDDINGTDDEGNNIDWYIHNRDLSNDIRELLIENGAR